ncbi:RNA-directed DNA polymerase (Reverse transcriptase), partial [Trifolium medium]|nr:RNA-directed DNA polymerase (Reverse transcriptase) [Trifolium medium]
MWTTHPDCDKIIKDCWGKTVVGCPMYILSQKLKLVKDKLKSWNKEPLLADEVIPKLITEDVNALITLLPSHQEITTAVFALNKDSASGPDGFGAFFFQHYWDCVKFDVYNAVLEFFSTSWILPGFNSNIIALLPKVSDATSIDQYRPIAMANFK